MKRKKLLIFHKFFFSINQIRIAMNSIGAIKTIDSDEKHLQETVR